MNYEYLCSNNDYINKLNKIIGVSNESKNFFKKAEVKQFNLNFDKELLNKCENTYKRLVALSF